MRTFALALLIPVVAAGMLVGCGSGGQGSDTAPTTVGSTTAATTAATTPAPSTTATTATTAAPSTTAPPTSVDDRPVSGEGVEIIVLVGTDDASTLGSRVEPVPLGSDVSLRLLDESTAQEYHVHGYDIEQSVEAGTEAVIEFTADKAGMFEVESHTTEKVLVVLEVS